MAIQASELRMGNWGYFTGNGNNNPVKVKELWNRELVCDYMGNELCLFYTEDDLQPIPLTESILVDCGFGKEEKETRRIDIDDPKKYRVYTKGYFTFNTIHGWWFNGKQLDIQPKYLHQLQNLYHSLTCTELTYTK